jgi:hypothetical protein
MTSKFLSQVVADDPVNLGAAWKGVDRPDRRLIDDEIQAMQKQLLLCLLRGIVATWMRLDGSGADGAAGDIVCASPTTAKADTVARALTSPLTSAGGAAFGMLLSGARAGSLCLVAMRGVIPPGIHGITPGTPGFIRINTPTARPEYVASLSAGDTPVGVIDPAGNLTLSFAALAATSSGGAPAYQDTRTISSATTTLLQAIPLADNTKYRIYIFISCRDTGNNEAEWISFSSWKRAGGGSASQLGSDYGPAPVSEISTSTLIGGWVTVSGSGNNVNVSLITSNSSHIVTTYRIYIVSDSLVAAT